MRYRIILLLLFQTQVSYICAQEANANDSIIENNSMIQSIRETAPQQKFTEEYPSIPYNILKSQIIMPYECSGIYLSHPYITNEAIDNLYNSASDMFMLNNIANTYKYDSPYLGMASINIARNIALTATGSYNSYIGLMDMRSATIGTQYQLGGMTISGDVAANRYLFFGRIFSQYGLSAQLDYKMNENLSLTLFSNYFNSNPFIGMGAFPYIPTTRYGGYMTIGNSRLSMNVGMQRRHNTIYGRMETVPIVTPSFKISKKIKIELPLGDLTKHILTEIFAKKQKIAPPPQQR